MIEKIVQVIMSNIGTANCMCFHNVPMETEVKSKPIILLIQHIIVDHVINTQLCPEE